jgi:4-amino-4-deoxy-L-arabinose transferase-like glycosyltransferase
MFNYMKRPSIDLNYFLVFLLASAFFLPFLGNVHLFDWDEINFAECSREMILTGNYLNPQINFDSFWEKPPLFIWFQSLSMHLFGVNEYAARFPNAVCGIATLILIYHLGKKLYSPTFGWLWVMAYFGSLLPHLYFKSGIIDPSFNLFIFIAFVFLIKNEKNKTPQYKPLLLGGISLGLAIMTKGPVGLLIVGLTWGTKLLIFKELSIKKIKEFSLFIFISLVTTSIWFGVETIKNGTWFLENFIEYNIRLAQTKDAGHGGFSGYHFVVLLLGCFPASIFALRPLFTRHNFVGENVDFTRWMKVLFWVVLILFSLVQTKIVHYSSMCYLPLTFMAALSLKSIIEDNKTPKFTANSILAIGCVVGFIVALIPFVGKNIELLKPFLQKDISALKMLDAPITWTGWESLVGFTFIIALITLYFSFRNSEKRQFGALIALFSATALFLNLVLAFFIKNIEGYSQNAPIEFYKSKAQEDCYMQTFSFKSYAHLFYAAKQKPTNEKYTDGDWLMRGDVDKPTYWVAKYNSKDELDTIPTLQFLYEKNGFVFYKRK